MPTIRPSSIRELQAAPNIGELLRGYATESAIDGMPAPDPQWPAYEQLEATGVLRVLAAFDHDTLIGFVALIFPRLPHYGALVATTESFFVDPAHRATGAGLRLLAAAERLAADHGAVGMLVSAPKGGRLESVLDRLPGYGPSNTIFFKRLTP